MKTSIRDTGSGAVTVSLFPFQRSDLSMFPSAAICDTFLEDMGACGSVPQRKRL